MNVHIRHAGLLVVMLALAGCGAFRNIADKPDDDTSSDRPDGSAGAGDGNNSGGKGGSGAGGAGTAGTGGVGSGDASAGTDAPDSNAEVKCNAGETRCAASTATVEACVGGQWTMLKTCPSICLNGACAGMCVPDERQCAAEQRPQLCNKDGEWTPAPEPCPNACTGAGKCAGECKPGTKKCGDPPNHLIPYECDETGMWIAKQACQNLCSSGSCGGSCMPGSRHCGAGNKPETCSPMGTWEPGQVCPDQTCVSGACSGVCAPNSRRCGANNNPQTCDPGGAWKEEAPCAGKACANGQCVGVCEPGKTRCAGQNITEAQICDANGAWVRGGNAECKKPNGQGCSGSGDCVSGYCVMGVCCATPCPPAGAGQCGNTGACGGGTCQKNVGATCGTNECTGGQETGPGTCNASGVCAGRSVKACPGGLTCDGTRCADSCVVGQTGGHCPAGRFCETPQKCSPRKAEHAACKNLGPGECTKGTCTSNYCCASGPCIAPGAYKCEKNADCASGKCNTRTGLRCSNYKPEDGERYDCGRADSRPATPEEIRAYCGGDPNATCVTAVNPYFSDCQ